MVIEMKEHDCQCDYCKDRECIVNASATRCLDPLCEINKNISKTKCKYCSGKESWVHIDDVNKEMNELKSQINGISDRCNQLQKDKNLLLDKQEERIAELNFKWNSLYNEWAAQKKEIIKLKALVKIYKPKREPGHDKSCEGTMCYCASRSKRRKERRK